MIQAPPQALTRLSWSSSVYGSEVTVEHSGCIAPGMHVRLTPGEWDACRAGIALVKSVEGRIVTFTTNLNTSIPAAACGDYIYPHIAACTQCTCKQCLEFWTKLKSFVDQFCFDHDDCKASLLSHACKMSSPNEGLGPDKGEPK